MPGIVGLGKAVELAKANMAERSAYETNLRDHLIERVTSEIPYTPVSYTHLPGFSGNRRDAGLGKVWRHRCRHLWAYT